MLNTVSLICINSALYSSSFFLRQIARSLCFFESNHRYYASHPFVFFSLSFCLASCCKFSMRSLLIIS